MNRSQISRLWGSQLIALITVLFSTFSFAREQVAMPSPTVKERTILFYGNSMIERLLEQGELEARLQIAHPEAKLQLRSLAWTGDEVGNRLRLEGYAKHMKNLLAQWPAGTVVLGYGLNESFAGEEGLPDFREQYEVHLSQLEELHEGAKFVLLSPIAISGASEERQAEVASYSQVIAELAKVHGAQFVDLFQLTKSHDSNGKEALTTNGIHLNSWGNSLVARALAQALSGKELARVDPEHLKQVALAAAAKQERVAEIVRPKNGVVYFGVRARPEEYADEMPRYHEMIRLTEEVVYQMAQQPGLKFSEVPEPSLPPMAEGKGRSDGNRTGVIKSVADNQAEFTTAEGFEVNLFASEEQFPELRNPVQIAFDARGRLWVVTMPSFPHTVPGLTPPDKIVILEDTDHDGQADKLTTFLEGLDALDGVAFHREGVIVSEQPRLWLVQDTDGDDRADTQRELLRGIDVTDSHHGGMIATDPFGDVIFSDGVFHRSQLETPFGVHRGIDATTYRLEVASGKIETEWQHTTPNPWNVAFDRWGNNFQMYGDGHVYDGTSLIWTPLGGYQPFRYANIASYGKGSGLAIVSSENFPTEFQQGMASASLLGRYAVTLTGFDFSKGMVKAGETLPILSSPNASFRPADLEFGMDGALYVSDFCSPIIGHAQHPMRDPHWDHDYGRIWRVVYTEKPLSKDWPRIEGASPEDLCELLDDSRDLVRHHVRIELRKAGSAGLQAVDEWIAAYDPESPGYEQAILETLFVAEGLDETRPALLARLLQSSSEFYRGAAIHTLRLQADRLPNAIELLRSVAGDSHPRVQIELIDAVAHLRPFMPEVEEVVANLKPLNKEVESSLDYLTRFGVEPEKGRSVPVLEVDPASQLTQWLWMGKKGESSPETYQANRESLPAEGLFRTFIESEVEQSAIIAINHKSVEVWLNESSVFSQDSFWSGDQQINVKLKKGVNVIEVFLKNPRNRNKKMPPVFVYSPVGQALSQANYLQDRAELNQLAASYDQMVAERGNVLRLQTAAGLQFSPKELRVEAGSKVRLVFENPDIMQHNWVLLTPGSTDEVGALADEMASAPDGVEKGYLPDSEKVLFASSLLAPNAREELVFEAPAQPGSYPFICTFPGHWRIMQGVLVVEEKLPAREKKEAPKAVTLTIGAGLVMETAPSPRQFNELVPPSESKGVVSANRKTDNEPLSSLTDGRIEMSFGPVFSNRISNGAYKMDLGELRSVQAITSWSCQQKGLRGAQKVTLYGSQSAEDPGWDVSDSSQFVELGRLSTHKQTLDQFVALSRRAAQGKSLGNYRWIVWQASPISKKGENTAFQELAVESSPVSQ